MAYLDTIVDFSKGSILKHGTNMLTYSVGKAIEGGRYIQPSSSLFPATLKKKYKARPITIELEFKGSDSESVTKSIAEFTKEVQEGIDLYLPDGFGYFCVLDDVSAPKQITSWISVVEFEFTGLRHGNKATVNVADGDTFYVGGMIETETVVTLVPTVETAEVTVIITDSNGNKVTDIKVSNVTYATVVDGITKKVTQDGVNKFGDTEMFEFPKLSVGKNTVSVTGDATVSVTYYPLFL